MKKISKKLKIKKESFATSKELELLEEIKENYGISDGIICIPTTVVLAEDTKLTDKKGDRIKRGTLFYLLKRLEEHGYFTKSTGIVLKILK